MPNPVTRLTQSPSISRQQSVETECPSAPVEAHKSQRHMKILCRFRKHENWVHILYATKVNCGGGLDYHYKPAKKLSHQSKPTPLYFPTLKQPGIPTTDHFSQLLSSYNSTVTMENLVPWFYSPCAPLPLASAERPMGTPMHNCGRPESHDKIKGWLEQQKVLFH